MFSEDYLNKQAYEIAHGTGGILWVLEQIRAFGEIQTEERFRYAQLWKRANALTYKFSRLKISVKTPLPEQLDDWLRVQKGG